MKAPENSAKFGKPTPRCTATANECTRRDGAEAKISTSLAQQPIKMIKNKAP